MGMPLREEIARARSGDVVCRDRIAAKISHGLGLDWDKHDGAASNGPALNGPALNGPALNGPALNGAASNVASNGAERSEAPASDLAPQQGVNGGSTIGWSTQRRAGALGTMQLLDSVLSASNCLEDLTDELPLDFRLLLAGPGQHLDGEERVAAVRESGQLSILLLDAPSRILLCERLYRGRTYYEIARDIGEPELQVSSRYLRALQAWLELASCLLENRAPNP